MSGVLNWISNNWFVIIAFISVIVVAVISIRNFLKLPSKSQVEKVKKCLLGWVIEAERKLGGGTGKVKLSLVYGWFIKAFPFLKNFISFELFSEWVDEALETMKIMLEENERLELVVSGYSIPNQDDNEEE